MKKLITFLVIILVAAMVIYKIDVKPEPEEVRREIQNDKLNLSN